MRLSTPRAIVARLAAIVVALLLSLSQRALPVFSSQQLSRLHPPIAVHMDRAVSGDLSAAVRVHRGERSLVVLGVTPLSHYWETLAMDGSPPLAVQLESAGWTSDGPPAQFERLMPMRPLPTVGSPVGLRAVGRLV